MKEVLNSEFGVNVWWTCPEFVMDGDRAQAVLEQYGFEADQMPLPSRAKAVSRAAYSFQDRRRREDRKVTEKTKNNSRYSVYGILAAKSKGDEEVAYEQETTVRYDKQSERVEANGPQADEFFKRLDTYTDAITDDDLRQFLRGVISMCYGISKRPSGGIYFVPQRSVIIIESAQNALDELKIGAKLYVERVQNGEQERAIVWEAVEMDIDKQIEQTLSNVERIGKRASSVQTHEAKLGELEGLMSIYRNLLGQEAKYEELAEKLEDASQTVAKKLAALQEAEANTPKPVVNPNAKRQTGGGNVIEKAKEILAKEGKPMHYTALVEKLEAEGVELEATKTKTKAERVNILLYNSLRKNSGLAKVGKGMYELA